MIAKQIKVTRWQCVCERCGTKWISQTEVKPLVCVSCKSRQWNKPKKEEK